MLGGTWLGYVYAIGVCGLAVGLIGCSTLLLYAIARVRGRRGAPRVRVVSMRSDRLEP